MKKQISKEFIFHTEQNRKRVRFQPSSLLTVKFDDTLWQSLTKLNFGGKASENIGGKNKEECKLREELFYNAGDRHLVAWKKNMVRRQCCTKYASNKIIDIFVLKCY